MIMGSGRRGPLICAWVIGCVACAIIADASADDDVHLGADPGLPLTVEDAFVPDPGEAELKLRLFYDRVRAGHRDRYTPNAEVEIGVARGLSVSFGLDYRLGNAGDENGGDVVIGGKWNFLESRDWLPALALNAGVAPSYGRNSGGTEATLGLFASKKLGDGDAPYLHMNVTWFRLFNRAEDERRDLYSLAVGLGVPVAERTAVVSDIVRAQSAERGLHDTLLELGVRHAAAENIVVAAGAGVGVGDSETDFRFLVGLMRSF